MLERGQGHSLDRMGALGRAYAWSGRIYGPERPFRRMARRTRALLLAALQPGSPDWLSALDTPALRPYCEANPLLALKPFRVYLSSCFGWERRVKILRDTYTLATVRGGLLRRALLAPGPILLSEWTFPQAGTVRLTLGRDARFRKEGEFVLALEAPHQGGRIMSLAFSLEHAPSGSLNFYIGSVQGEEGRADAIRRLTKAFHGLRPKALMLEAAQLVARALGARYLLGVGESIQAHRRKHAIHLPGLHALGFDYDGLWLESGGVELADGWFHLPLEPHRKGADEIRPNKRAQYQRRYALLDGLRSRIDGAFPRHPEAKTA